MDKLEYLPKLNSVINIDCIMSKKKDEHVTISTTFTGEHAQLIKNLENEYMFIRLNKNFEPKSIHISQFLH